MEQDIERFLKVLEGERGFSVNTIFAYRNDLNQFCLFLSGERAASVISMTTYRVSRVV